VSGWCYCVAFARERVRGPSIQNRECVGMGVELIGGVEMAWTTKNRRIECGTI